MPGEIVERAPVDALFEAPEHPYTVGPAGLDPAARSPVDKLATIAGVLPDMRDLPIGLPFRAALPVRRRICLAAPTADDGCRGRPLVACVKAPLENWVCREPALLEVRGAGPAFRRAPFGIRPADRHGQSGGRH